MFYNDFTLIYTNGYKSLLGAGLASFIPKTDTRNQFPS